MTMLAPVSPDEQLQRGFIPGTGMVSRSTRSAAFLCPGDNPDDRQPGNGAFPAGNNGDLPAINQMVWQGNRMNAYLVID
ncbi:hypothetical protein ABL142_005288 [Salmonella enterica]|nr:hypothetical protein [Salmonella enterica]